MGEDPPGEGGEKTFQREGMALAKGLRGEELSVVKGPEVGPVAGGERLKGRLKEVGRGWCGWGTRHLPGSLNPGLLLSRGTRGRAPHGVHGRETQTSGLPTRSQGSGASLTSISPTCRCSCKHMVSSCCCRCRDALPSGKDQEGLCCPSKEAARPRSASPRVLP